MSIEISKMAYAGQIFPATVSGSQPGSLGYKVLRLGWIAFLRWRPPATAVYVLVGAAHLHSQNTTYTLFTH